MGAALAREGRNRSVDAAVVVIWAIAVTRARRPTTMEGVAFAESSSWEGIMASSWSRLSDNGFLVEWRLRVEWVGDENPVTD